MDKIMTSWKVSLIAGIALGAVVASAGWYFGAQRPSDEAMAMLAKETEVLSAHNASWESKFQQLDQAAGAEITRLREELEQNKLASEEALAAQKADYEKQLSNMKTEQKTMIVTQKKLDTQVVKLTSTAEKQKVVLDNSKALYQQQLRLQKQVSHAETEVKKAQRTAKEFKKPCDEFKSGTSWNWVSQADCDKYEAKLKAVDESEAQLAALQEELEALNQKIDIEIPRPQ